jgi:ABC-type polysaccharide/polyol phosphate transport system ATPase subunit
MPVITCNHVSKIFRRHVGQQLVRQYISRWLRSAQSPREEFHALRDVSFAVEEGEGIAVIGINGAGKSTLLSLIAGLSRPDVGTIDVRGRVAPLMTLGAGFHPELTGAENLMLNASLLGFSRSRARELAESIVAFAEVEDFIDEPLRTYSTGMTMRLAFSIAVNVDPDILIVDEVLAVGDANFQAKSYDRIRQLRGSGKTFVCASHVPRVLKELCDRALWLDNGQLVMAGPIGDVLSEYEGHPARRAARAASLPET